MKIYTRTGDGGSTGLFGGSRLDKDATRIEAYGTIDELNACLGVAASINSDPDVASIITRVQNELFVIGSDLATPLDQDSTAAAGVPRMSAEPTARLEREIDEIDSEIGSLMHFILPGGSHCGSLLHQARCVCRRAERVIVRLSREENINDLVLPYVNRLSDHLFELARLVNHRERISDIIWSRESIQTSA